MRLSTRKIVYSIFILVLLVFLGVFLLMSGTVITKQVKIGEIFELKLGESAYIKEADLNIKYKKFKKQECSTFNGNGHDINLGECRVSISFGGTINETKYDNLAGALYGTYYFTRMPWLNHEADGKVLKLIMYKKDDCAPIKDDKTRDFCLLDRKDIFSCGEIKDKAYRFNCTSDLLRQSIKSGKLSEDGLKVICEKNMDGDKWCLSMYNLIKTKTTNNAVFCEGVVDTKAKDTCWAEMAKFNKNGNFCSNIENIEVKDFCYMNITQATGQGGWCDKITWGDVKKEICKDSQDGIEGIKRICERWELSTNTTECLDSYYAQTAPLVREASLCNKISDSTRKDYCLKQVNEYQW